MNDLSVLSMLVLLATAGFVVWGGFVCGPQRIVPFLLLFGPFFLPARDSIDLPGLPALDRLTVVTIPTALLLFATPAENWRRLRLMAPDYFLVVFVAWTAVCTVKAQGPWAAQSMVMKHVLTLAMPYLAGRLFLQKPGDIVTLVRFAAPLAILYVPLMLFEARMYPRFSEWVYSSPAYGLLRGAWYRPVVFTENTLELGHTMVLLTLLMLAVYAMGGEMRKAAGRLLGPGLVAGVAAVFLCLSRGPIVGLALLLVVPQLVRRSNWIACGLGVAGVAFFVWMLRPGGSSAEAALALADSSTETGSTLFYRFLQIEAFKPMVQASPLFGYGESWNREMFAIIDGELLLTVLGFGYPGVILLSMFWLSSIWVIAKRSFPPAGLFQRVGLYLAPALGWLVFSAWGDSFMRAPHYLVIGGVLGAVASLRTSAEEDRVAVNPIRSVSVRYG